MPFPTKDPDAPPKPRPVWGKNKSRKYAVWYTSRKAGTATEPETWKVGEFRGQHLKGVHNAVVRHLRVELDRPDLKASDILIVEAHILPPRTSLEKYLSDLFGTDEEE
jgi:hypothetical protein